MSGGALHPAKSGTAMKGSASSPTGLSLFCVKNFPDPLDGETQAQQSCPRSTFRLG